MKPTLCIPLVALCILLIAGCATPQGDTTSEQRASIQQMVQDTLAEAYRLNPASRIESSGRLAMACSAIEAPNS